MQGVDYNELGVGVQMYKICDLYFQAVSDTASKVCEVQGWWSIFCYLKQTGLDSCKAIFQTEVEDCSNSGRKIPDWFAFGDLKAEP